MRIASDSNHQSVRRALSLRFTTSSAWIWPNRTGGVRQLLPPRNRWFWEHYSSWKTGG